MIKLIIAGGRDLNRSVGDIENDLICTFGFSHEETLEIVSGCAKGIDACGEAFADHCGFEVKEFPANWKEYKHAAGPIRNRQMAEYADALLLIWDGKSKGSANMKKEMERLDKEVYEVIVK